MRIEIHTGKFSLTESLRTYIERRTQFAFSWAQQSLQKISLRLDDLNRP
jgi:ribosome-associated translation inhibitor RaiA